jgi:hypothetical protein
MNQLSSIGFGTDATVFAGYAQSAGDRLGKIDFIFENTGPNQAYIKLGQYDGTTSPSGYAQIGDAFTVAPGGALTKSYVLLSKRVAFFGSGSTTVNISTAIRNKGDLRGAQIDIVATWAARAGVSIPPSIRQNSPRSGVLLHRSRPRATSTLVVDRSTTTRTTTRRRTSVNFGVRY